MTVTEDKIKIHFRSRQRYKPHYYVYSKSKLYPVETHKVKLEKNRINKRMPKAKTPKFVRSAK